MFNATMQFTWRVDDILNRSIDLLIIAYMYCKVWIVLAHWNNSLQVSSITGADPGARPPPPKIGKNKIFLCKIVIFHTKYRKKFRASFRSTQFF